MTEATLEAWSGSARVRSAGWCAGKVVGLTYPAEAPIKRIDYLFLARARLLDRAGARNDHSDHRPVLVTLTGGP